MTKISNQYSLTNILTADLANSRLGIGTASPSTKVHIYEPLTNASAYLTVQNNRARNSAVYTQTTNGGFYAGTSIGTDTFNYQIYDAVAGAARLTIASNGAATFSGSITSNSGDIFATDGTRINFFGVSTGASLGYVGTTTNHPLAFLTNNTEKIRITSGGNVGIGETSPSHKLTISNGSNNVTSAQFFNYTGDQTATNFISRGARADTFYHIQAFTSTSTEVFRVEASGNVKNANNSYGAISDIKLKENIIDATPKLEDLLKVKVCNYNFKGNKTKQIGVIAQELEKIFPSMVEESEDRDDNGVFLGTTTKSVKYSIFVPMLIKAVQELKAEIETLKNK